MQLGSSIVFVFLLRIDCGTALYRCIVTASTVGYGDLSPSNAVSKVLTMAFVLVGVAVVFYQTSQVLAAASDECEAAATQPPRRRAPPPKASPPGTSRSSSERQSSAQALSTTSCTWRQHGRGTAS